MYMKTELKLIPSAYKFNKQTFSTCSISLETYYL